MTQPQPEAAKVRFFGARQQARDLLRENANLREQLAQLGALSVMELEQRAAAAHQALTLAEQRTAEHHDEIERLQGRLIDVRGSISAQDVGLYDFEHAAEHSAELAAELAATRAEIKKLAKEGRATSSTTNFTFNNSTAKGRQFVKAMSAMMLSAYNAEAENCVKTVRAGRLETARKRLDRVVDRVARNGRMIDLRITTRYHRLRLEELSLAARHLQAVQAEKEAERERRAELREQKKVEAELKRERERLQKEHDHYRNAITALRARGDDAGAAELEAKLADVDHAIENVDYRTANIRAGYVYVISNVGSFGPHVVKIGMTRRLDPMDRVRELGDASVPFRFDVHAMFFSEDAVSIEAMLHREFADRRLNRINTRREYFYCTPDEVLAKLKAHNVAIVEFDTHAEAEEFRLSRAMAGDTPEGAHSDIGAPSHGQPVNEQYDDGAERPDEELT